VKIVDPNHKLISSEQLRLMYILLQGHVEGTKGDGVTQVQQAGDAPHGCRSNVLATGTFTKFPVIIFIALSEIMESHKGNLTSLTADCSCNRSNKMDEASSGS
jgi:hypothetical protein